MLVKLNNKNNFIKDQLNRSAVLELNRSKMSSRASSGNTMYRNKGRRIIESIPKIKIVPAIFKRKGFNIENITQSGKFITAAELKSVKGDKRALQIYNLLNAKKSTEAMLEPEMTYYWQKQETTQFKKDAPINRHS